MATRLRSSSPSDRWLFISLLGILIWAPLPFGGNRPLMWAVTEVWILLTGAAWLVSYLRNQTPLQPAFVNAKFVLLLLLFTSVWILFQSTVESFSSGEVISQDQHISLIQFIKSLSYLTLFALCLLLIRSHRRLQQLAILLVVCGTFQAVSGVLVALTDQSVASGTFINRNHFAGYLEMTLAIGIGLLIANLHQDQALNWRSSVRRWITTLLGSKARLRICLALMVIGLIMSLSRMGNIAFFSSMMIAGVIGLALFRRSSRAVVILFVSLIVIDIFLMGTFFGIDKLQQRLATTSLATEQRDEVDLLSLPIVEDHLFAGTGAGSFYSTFPRYRDETISGFYYFAHNDFVEFALEYGLIGFIPLALIVVLSFITAIRAQMVRRSRLMQGMGFSSTMAIIAIMLHSTTDFNLQITGTAVTFMVVLALPWIALHVERDS